MSKKKPGSGGELKVIGISIHRRTSVKEGTLGAPLRLDLSVEVENSSEHPLHVWATPKSHAYDAATHVLSVGLAEPTQELRPHIKMLSDHPRSPTLVVVNAGSRVKIKVDAPATFRGRSSVEGLAWEDKPIGQIARVDLRVQYAPAAIQYRSGESASDFRTRLRQHGDVVQAVITPTTETEK
jgi:hypothetical protein